MRCLARPHDTTARIAARALADHGDAAVPPLLDAVRSDDARLALRAGELGNQARTDISVAFDWMEHRPLKDPKRVEDVLQRLEPLNEESFFKAAVLLLWIEADRQGALPEAAARKGKGGTYQGMGTQHRTERESGIDTRIDIFIQTWFCNQRSHCIDLEYH